MSIRIQKINCVGCGQCIKVCPGNLIKKDEAGKAYIKHFKDCWGCTSCLKECKTGAISFYLGADIGGKGGTMTVLEEGELCTWQIKDLNGNVEVIKVNKKDSNKY